MMHRLSRNPVVAYSMAVLLVVIGLALSVVAAFNDFA